MLVVSCYLLLSLTPYSASATTLVCNNCAPSTAYKKVLNIVCSKTTESSTRFVDDFIVINVLENKVYGWKISARWLLKGGNDPELDFKVSTLRISNDVINQVRRLHRTPLVRHLRQATRGINIPADSGLASAWDIARNSSNHVVVSDWYKANYPLDYYIHNAVQVAGSLPLLKYPLDVLRDMNVVFIFDDGSSVKFRPPAMQDQGYTLTYVPKSAQDSDSNRITDQGESLIGDYSFTTKDRMNDFIERARRYGVTITHHRASGGRYKYSITRGC
ncbi:hypothetical protein ACMAZF_19855 [Psychrobium sp. nBUS_13]|uniref:hypothetical protein n=1 Tax=Psychrobium sp. nBUS_13 TaxID=3395319 RepID=UPI003EBF29D1